MPDEKQKPSIPESPLHMAQRHVSEEQARIARQEELIAELDRGGHGHMLPEAREQLRVMRESQATAEARLARELVESAGAKPG